MPEAGSIEVLNKITKEVMESYLAYGT